MMFSKQSEAGFHRRSRGENVIDQQNLLTLQTFGTDVANPLPDFLPFKIIQGGLLPVARLLERRDHRKPQTSEHFPNVIEASFLVMRLAGGRRNDHVPPKSHLKEGFLIDKEGVL